MFALSAAGGGGIGVVVVTVGCEVGAVAVAHAYVVAYGGMQLVYGPLSDRWGYHRVMQFGPLFGLVAVPAFSLGAVQRGVGGLDEGFGGAGVAWQRGDADACSDG